MTVLLIDTEKLHIERSLVIVTEDRKENPRQWLALANVKR